MGSAERQGKAWGERAETWAEIQEPLERPFFEAALDAIGVAEGVTLLDAGCGSGLALQMAQQRGAEVHGFDAAAGLLAIAATRLPGVDLRQGDLEDLPYDENLFDAVTAFNSVQFTENPDRALSEIARVCRQGGAVALVTWAPADESDSSALFQNHDGPPDDPDPFELAARGVLEARMTNAGIAVEGAIEVPTPFVYANVETAARIMDSTAPAAFGPFLQADGSVVLNNLFRVVYGTA